jgi:hypothetical protein
VVDPGRPTDASIILGIRSACRLPKATDTHSEYVILRFHVNGGYANEPRYYFYTFIACLVGICVMSADVQ